MENNIQGKPFDNEMYQKELKILAQEAYCAIHKVPNFVGDGRCYSCYRNVFNDMTLEKAGSKHITGCPYCHTSFCD